MKIHKRERSSPTPPETGSSSQAPKKRYKLVENFKVKAEPISKQVKVAPEDRADFLREVSGDIGTQGFLKIYIIYFQSAAQPG